MTPGHPSPPLEDLRRLGQFLVDQASPATARLVARRALATHRPPVRRWRWVVVLTAGGLLSSSSVALGMVADDAAPGDLLYGVDRGMETVISIFGPIDHSGERIDEAEVLLARGDLPRAVLALGEAVETHDLATAQELAAASGELSAAETTAAVEDLVADLVADARLVVAAAQSGDHDALKAAIAAMQERTGDLTTAADSAVISPDSPSVTAPGQKNGNGNDSATDNPSVTAPGQANGKDKDNPSVTAPGQGNGNDSATDNPSVTAPGQANGKDKDNPSVTAPGQSDGNGNGNGQGSG